MICWEMGFTLGNRVSVAFFSNYPISVINMPLEPLADSIPPKKRARAEKTTIRSNISIACQSCRLKRVSDGRLLYTVSFTDYKW